MKKILVIGDSIIDHYILCKSYRMSSEQENMPIYDIEQEAYMLGGAMNVASNLKLLCSENDAIYSGIVSDLCLRELKQRNIFVSNCAFTNDFSSQLSLSDNIIKTRIIDLEQEKQVARIDNKKRFSDDMIKKFNFLFERNRLNDFDAIAISDYGKGTVSELVIDKLKEYKNGTIFIDTKKQDLSIWRHLKSYVIKINLNEYLNSKHGTDEKVQNLIITKGPEGAELLQFGKVKFKLGVEKIEERPRVIGAGDVFLASLITTYLNTNDFYESIREGNRAASILVTKREIGTNTISKEEMK
jgi:D-beta-D-heptose 7-phosphate kinase/D-beta-D-heptose 1-phosphate adenosyltransferase